MAIASSEQIVFIGPGSEWLWSMAQFVVVAITLVGIYYQFRLQRSANAFEHANRIQAEWQSEQRIRSRLSALRAVKAGKPLPLSAFLEIANFWDTVASLVRRGHVDARVVYDSLGNAAFIWWTLFEPQVRGLGEEAGAPMTNFEWLVGVFAAFVRPGEMIHERDRAKLLAAIDEDIEAIEERLEALEDSRRVFVVPERRGPRHTGGTT